MGARHLGVGVGVARGGAQDEHAIPRQLVQLRVLDQDPVGAGPHADSVPLVVRSARRVVVVGSVPADLTAANRDVVVVLRADDAVVVPVVRRHLQDRPLGELERHVAWQLDPGRVDVVGQLSDEVAPWRHDDLVEAVVDRPSDGLVHPLPGQDGIAAVVVDLPLIELDGVLVDVHRRQRRRRPVSQRPSTLAVAWNRFHRARVALRGISRRRPVEPRDRGASILGLAGRAAVIAAIAVTTGCEQDGQPQDRACREPLRYPATEHRAIVEYCAPMGKWTADTAHRSSAKCCSSRMGQMSCGRCTSADCWAWLATGLRIKRRSPASEQPLHPRPGRRAPQASRAGRGDARSRARAARRRAP